MYRGFLTSAAADELAHSTWDLAMASEWIAPKTPSGKPFSVRQTNFGALGWISDRKGYRYEPHHPESGTPWPPIPDAIMGIWESLVGTPSPECCLVNHYDGSAKMGLHRDADEDDLDTASLSISLGQPARFRLGGPARKGPTRSLILHHGDVMVMGGPSRNFYHGIDRLVDPDPLFAPKLPFAGRINLTLRRVTRS